MSRDYPDRPMVGVGIVLVDGDRVLLVQRGKPPKKGSWSIPGGAVELGETLESAVRRELLEETGLTASNLHFLTTVELIDRDDEGAVRHHYTLIDYAARLAGGTAMAGDDAQALQWCGPKELAELSLWSETRRIIKMALDLKL